MSFRLVAQLACDTKGSGIVGPCAGLGQLGAKPFEQQVQDGCAHLCADSFPLLWQEQKRTGQRTAQHVEISRLGRLHPDDVTADHHSEHAGPCVRLPVRAHRPMMLQREALLQRWRHVGPRDAEGHRCGIVYTFGHRLLGDLGDLRVGGITQLDERCTNS